MPLYLYWIVRVFVLVHYPIKTKTLKEIEESMDIVISLISAAILGIILAVIDGVGADFIGYYNSKDSDKRDRK